LEWDELKKKTKKWETNLLRSQ